MAVLPTPGSPIRAGLFLVRRLRISSSGGSLRHARLPGPSCPAAPSPVGSRPVFLERLVGVFWVLAGDRLAAADLAQGFEHRVFGDAEIGEGFAFGAVGQPEQDVFGIRYIRPPCPWHSAQLRPARLQPGAKARLAAGTAIDFGRPESSLRTSSFNMLEPTVCVTGRHGTLGLVEQRQQKVTWFDGLMVETLAPTAGR